MTRRAVLKIVSLFLDQSKIYATKIYSCDKVSRKHSVGGQRPLLLFSHLSLVKTKRSRVNHEQQDNQVT
ncbi:hypothetical protein GLN3_17280 (plasmid) [Geobacillus lituanicus]|nr:hypothetical protein GLN3_17280 [Geobacillus lituanicus]